MTKYKKYLKDLKDRRMKSLKVIEKSINISICKTIRIKKNVKVTKK